MSRRGVGVCKRNGALPILAPSTSAIQQLTPVGYLC